MARRCALGTPFSLIYLLHFTSINSNRRLSAALAAAVARQGRMRRSRADAADVGSQSWLAGPTLVWQTRTWRCTTATLRLGASPCLWSVAELLFRQGLTRDVSDAESAAARVWPMALQVGAKFRPRNAAAINVWHGELRAGRLAATWRPPWR